MNAEPEHNELFLLAADGAPWTPLRFVRFEPGGRDVAIFRHADGSKVALPMDAVRPAGCVLCVPGQAEERAAGQAAGEAVTGKKKARASRRRAGKASSTPSAWRQATSKQRFLLYLLADTQGLSESELDSLTSSGFDDMTMSEAHALIVRLSGAKQGPTAGLQG